MNVHKHARMTVHGRYLVVCRVRQEGWRVRDAAVAAGISPRTASKWLARYRAGGMAKALRDRGSAPRRCRHRLAAARVAEIERLRRLRWSSPRIARALGMPVSTVGAVLRRLGLGRLAALEPKAPAVRYERARPGELIHIDTKKLGRIDGVGHRITGDRTRRKRGLGWEHLHVAIDDCSRLAYTEILPDERGETCAGFLDRAVRWFAGCGVRIERVMTDNAFAYTNSRVPSRTPSSQSAPATSQPGLTGPAPTERPSASSRPPCASGSTPKPTIPPSKGPPTCPLGSTGTITIDLIPPSKP